MMTPLSIEERVDRIERRLDLAATVIGDGIDHPHCDSKVILEGLRQLLEDVFGDLESLQKLPFPLSEYRGEPFEKWLERQMDKQSLQASR